jgi:hypothetical protein
MPATSAEALLAELEALELTQPIGDPLDDEYRAVTARLAETSYALLTEMRKLGPPSAPNTSLSAAARAAIEERVAQLERMSEVLKDEQRALLAQIRKRDAEEEAGDAGKRAAARTKEPRRARTPKPAAATTAAEPALRSPEERIALADRIIATAVPLLWALSGGADDKLHVYEHLLRAGGIWVDTRYATARVPLYVNQLHDGGRPTSAVLQPLLAALPELELRLQIDNDGSTLSTMLTQAQLDQELVFWHGRLLHYVARAGPFPREHLGPKLPLALDDTSFERYGVVQAQYAIYVDDGTRTLANDPAAAVSAEQYERLQPLLVFQQPAVLPNALHRTQAVRWETADFSGDDASMNITARDAVGASAVRIDIVPERRRELLRQALEIDLAGSDPSPASLARFAQEQRFAEAVRPYLEPEEYLARPLWLPSLGATLYRSRNQPPSGHGTMLTTSPRDAVMRHELLTILPDRMMYLAPGTHAHWVVQDEAAMLFGFSRLELLVDLVLATGWVAPADGGRELQIYVASRQIQRILGMNPPVPTVPPVLGARWQHAVHTLVQRYGINMPKFDRGLMRELVEYVYVDTSDGLVALTDHADGAVYLAGASPHIAFMYRIEDLDAQLRTMLADHRDELAELLEVPRVDTDVLFGSPAHPLLPEVDYVHLIAPRDVAATEWYLTVHRTTLAYGARYPDARPAYLGAVPPAAAAVPMQE